ncbi:hypothetical protein CRG98_004245 [Punica granatum]|uniref:Uncharacterized protein n=1 Tax=Punica granatum TaxID=22663 RepID=A0A2I0L3T0_PUNGR|nr:hypothetical protein CRG98_004245 [Punica granatum]
MTDTCEKELPLFVYDPKIEGRKSRRRKSRRRIGESGDSAGIIDRCLGARAWEFRCARARLGVWTGVREHGLVRRRVRERAGA